MEPLNVTCCLGLFDGHRLAEVIGGGDLGRAEVTRTRLSLIQHLLVAGGRTEVPFGH